MGKLGTYEGLVRWAFAVGFSVIERLSISCSCFLENVCDFIFSSARVLVFYLVAKLNAINSLSLSRNARFGFEEQDCSSGASFFACRSISTLYQYQF